MIMSEWKWELFWFSGQGSFLWGGDIWKRDLNKVREQMMWRYEGEQFKQREQWRLKKENKLEVLEEQQGVWVAGAQCVRWDWKGRPSEVMLDGKGQEENFMDWWSQDLYLDLLHFKVYVYHSTSPIHITFYNTTMGSKNFGCLKICN